MEEPHYDDLGQPFTKEQTDMLGIILTGGLVTMDRFAGAGLKDAWGGHRQKLCLFCNKGVVEDAEHVYWDCEAWAECRRKALRILEKLSRGVLKRPLEHFSKWPKWVKSTGLVPRDQRLDQQNMELAEGVDRQVTRREHVEANGTQGHETARDTVHLNEVGQVIVYTDGGCTDPQYRRLRRATYGVYYHDDHPWNCSSALMGIEQTCGEGRAKSRVGRFRMGRGANRGRL